MSNEQLAISNQQLARNNKGNILLVDDTPANLRLLTGILSEQGYKVRPACDGFQALSTAQGVTIDLILLDINMPQLAPSTKNSKKITCG